MTFLWPHALWLLLAFPGLIALYFALLRRRRPALRYPSVAYIAEAMVPGSHLRRHLPAVFVMLALVASIVAVARPVTVVILPSEQRTIVLAIDVSTSMGAKDVQPSRFAAAKTAAIGFARDLPRDVRLGIVAFASDADLVQVPTLQHEEAVSAIQHLQMRSGTAIASGIIASLLTLFPDSGIGGNYDIFGVGRSPVAMHPLALDEAFEVKRAHRPVRPGSYTAAAIILLTDGSATTGPVPSTAAGLAAQRGVRVYTIGFGQPRTLLAELDGRMEDASFDADALMEIASLTAAEYFHASTAQGLKQIYRGLRGRVVAERQETEVTAPFSALAALLLVFGGLSAALLNPLFSRDGHAQAVGEAIFAKTPKRVVEKHCAPSSTGPASSAASTGLLVGDGGSQ